MSTVERKEYQETKIMRTVSPVRNYRSASSQNLAEFDHNLDYLLEDLQNSVSRPGSSLGTYGTTRTLESNRSNSLNRFNNVKAANPVQEYSSDDAYTYTSPDGSKKVTGYKKESYSYKTTAPTQEKVRMQNSINQLDSLLDDLQQVKNSSTFERESYNSLGSNPDVRSSKRSVQRELHYGDTPRPSSRTRTLEREYTSEGTYGDLRQIRTTSPSPSSRTSTLSKQTKVTNLHSYPVEVVETTTPDINPEILEHLDPNLHPPGNTKVTTTIKTYTYEIPGSGPYPTNLATDTIDNKYVYTAANQSQSTPSKSFVYQKIDKSSSNDIINYQPYQKPAPPGGHTLIKETVTTRNYQPGYNPEIPPTNQSYVYNETTTTRNINDNYPPPQRQDAYFIKEVETSHTNNTRDYRPPVTQTYIKEIHDRNTTTRNIQNGYPPSEPNNKTIIYKHETHTTNSYGPDGRPRNQVVETFDPKNPPYNNNNNINKPSNEPVNIQYRYKSESTTTNNYKAGYPHGDDSQILLPKRFPTEDGPDGPPKRLDDLMRDIGSEPPNSPLNAGYNAHEQELEHKKKIDTLKRQQEQAEDLQKKEPISRTKNVSGPPVYYPPGHEMFAKKEEEGAAWRAQGGYERAAGKYEYEAQSGSKSKSKSGAAIVPVCLPLCCGLPCTIL